MIMSAIPDFAALISYPPTRYVSFFHLVIFIGSLFLDRYVSVVGLGSSLVWELRHLTFQAMFAVNNLTLFFFLFWLKEITCCISTLIQRSKLWTRKRWAKSLTRYEFYESAHCKTVPGFLSLFLRKFIRTLAFLPSGCGDFAARARFPVLSLLALYKRGRGAPPLRAHLVPATLFFWEKRETFLQTNKSALLKICCLKGLCHGDFADFLV